MLEPRHAASQDELSTTMDVREGSKDGLNPIYAETVSSQTMTDAERLRMLGYDMVLDRPYSFWGLFCMNIFHESILYEFMLAISLYAYNAPLLFIIGYPIQCLLHLGLLGTFSELASAYPAAGATATWAWRCARAGIRHERQWGYFVSGLVLASHLGRNLAALYNGAYGITSIYVTMAGPKKVPQTLTGIPLDPKDWWNPVWYISMITLAALVIFSRMGRSNIFWIITASIYGIYLFIALVLIFYAGHKSGHPRMSQLKLLGIRREADWKWSDAYMIFTGIPLKMIAIDCPAHMAEETRNPAKTVPRVMIASTITHFAAVYLMVLAYIFCLVPTWGNLGSTTSPFVPIVMALGLTPAQTYTLGIFGIVIGNLMTTSSVLVMTRFVFALARDFAIPFSSRLLQINKGKEPWLADIAIFLALYASVAAFWVSPVNYYTLTTTFGYFFLAFPYTVVLIIYVLSDLQPGSVDRSEFSLGRWSKPVACISAVWGILTIIQGCLPGHHWTIQTVKLSPNSISFLPMVLGGMVVVMAISWLIYGRRHYIGPIRAITKWSAGIEIDPKEFTTAAGRGAAIRSYVLANTRSSGSGGTRYKPSNLLHRLFRGSKSQLPHSTPMSTHQEHKAPRPQEYRTATADGDVIPESGLLPQTRGRNYFSKQSRSTSGGGIESIQLSDMTDSSRERIADQNAISHALVESSLELQTQPALAESQLEPRTQHALMESMLEPRTQHALDESILEPRSQVFTESDIDPQSEHAMIESQLDPEPPRRWMNEPGTRSFGVPDTVYE